MRLEWDGSSPKANLASPLTDVAMTVVCDDLTGWPTGASFPFIVTINRDLPDEERILCSSRSGNTLTVHPVDVPAGVPSGGRAWDTTVAQAHSSGTVEHTLSAEAVAEMNRIANTLTTVGDVYVFDGTNVVRLAKGSDYDVLMSLASLPNDIGWVTSLIERTGTPPTIVNGRMYYDTTYDALMVAESGSWVPASRGTFVFANTTARDAFFGASGPAGQLAFTTDTEDLWVGLGDGWRRVPGDKESIVHFTDATARDAYFTAPSDGQVVFLTASQTHWKYRDGTGWFRTFPRIVTGSTLPPDLLEGDLWLQDVIV